MMTNASSNIEKNKIPNKGRAEQKTSSLSEVERN